MSHKRTNSLYDGPLYDDGIDTNANTKPDEARPLPGDVVPAD